MIFRLIYPSWTRLEGQTLFVLPPLGPSVFAATLPEDVTVDFIDDNLQSFSYDDPVDFVGISVMITAQIRRGWEIADEYRRRGKKVIFGGVASTLHAEETLEHADSVFLGEAEGRTEQVIRDFKEGKLKKIYNYLPQPPDVSLIGPARRSILNEDLYYHKGIRMVDLFQASRGCRFSCYPCAASFLGGRKFRPRPFDKVAEELDSIDNNRLFVVDNSLAQDKEWEKELFRMMAPFKKNWCSHTIDDDPEILDLAAKAGAWYVYQAVLDDSDYIRRRIQRYHDFGIAVEATVLLGTDNQTEDDILRLIDFLLEVRLDLAEFTVLTPFRHTKVWDDMERDNRIIDRDWNHHNAGTVVFRPRHMSPERLQKLYHYAWEQFYKDETQEQKMFKLIMRVVEKERAMGTYRPARRDLARLSFGKPVDR
jgi:radical SAM superfamily enzyme YgiQ (UPF0313 family)